LFNENNNTAEVYKTYTMY